MQTGATQIHVAVNSLGERAGNASLEQTVAALELIYGVHTGINMKHLTKTSKLVQKCILITLPPNYPIVGENAFTQETGIHVHGFLAKKETYEPYPPEVVGQTRRITIGKSTGHHAIEHFLQSHRYHLNEAQLREIVNRVRDIVALKKKMTDKEVLFIAQDVIDGISERSEDIKLQSLIVQPGTIPPSANVTLEVHGNVRTAKASALAQSMHRLMPSVQPLENASH